MSVIEVVRNSELQSGDLTNGIVRRRAFESQDAIVSESRVAAGVVSGWHHHGTRHLYGFTVSGRLELEYWLIKAVKVEARTGDFFHIPAGLIHRDLNPENDHELVVVNILVGTGPSVVNVAAPSA